MYQCCYPEKSFEREVDQQNQRLGCFSRSQGILKMLRGNAGENNQPSTQLVQSYRQHQDGKNDFYQARNRR